MTGIHHLEELLHYFQSGELQFWDVFAVLILFSFLFASFILAYREHRMRLKAKRLVHRRYSPTPGYPTRRLFPRLMVRIPARVMVENARNVIEAEVLDVSAGGIRLLLFDAPRVLNMGERIDLVTRDPLFIDMRRARVEVVRVRPGPKPSTPTVHGKWIGLPADVSRRLSREIRRRLLHNP